MAYVIAEPCVGTKDTACVDVCPGWICIHPRKDEAAFETEKMLYISPDECIDCGACVPVCPVTAIFALEDLPEKWNSYTPINADWYRTSRLRFSCVRRIGRPGFRDGSCGGSNGPPLFYFWGSSTLIRVQRLGAAMEIRIELPGVNLAVLEIDGVTTGPADEALAEEMRLACEKIQRQFSRSRSWS